MRYIILLVVLFSCMEEGLKKESNFRCLKMTISDATPIQFWVNGEETFNESNPICGLTSQCFCQPFNCDDEIKIQIQDNTGNEFDLVLYDTTDTEITRVSFEEVSDGVFQVSFTPSNLSPSVCQKVYFNIESAHYSVLFDYELDDADQAFTARTNLGNFWGISPNGLGWTQTENLSFGGFTFPNGVWFYNPPNIEGNINNSNPVSEHLIQEFDPITTDNLKMDVTSGDYEFSFNATPHEIFITYNVFSGGDVIATYDKTITATGGSPNTGNLNETINFGAVVNADKIRIRITESGIATVFTFSFDTDGFTKLDLYAEDYVLGTSDCIDLRNNHQCSKLIEYTNADDFDGIAYDISPQPTFYLRVPAQLLKDENPQTQEDLELSNGTIVTVRQTIQEKSIFKLGYMPPYMHTKIQKILMHDTVIIDGIQWKRRDAYEAPRLEDYPLKKGEVLLTKYNSVLKNTI